MRLQTLLLSLVAVSPAFAQTGVSVTGKALTPLAVVARASSQSAYDSAAKDATFKPSRPLRASARVQPPNGSYSGSTTIAQVSSFVAMGSVFERHYARGAVTDGGGTSASASANGATKGPHSVLLTFAGAPSTKGRVVVSFRANVQYGTNKSLNKGAVDIGNDNSVEWSGGGSGSQAVTKEFPASLDKNGGLAVRLTTESAVFGTGDPRDFVNCWSELYVTFKAADQGKCTVQPYGKGCGPKLDAAVATISNNNVVVWKLTGGFKNGFAVNIVGTQALNLQLGGGCSLLANAVVLTLVKTDANGEWKNSDIVPMRNFTSYHQSLPIDVVNNTLILKASNGQKLSCTGF